MVQARQLPVFKRLVPENGLAAFAKSITMPATSSDSGNRKQETTRIVCMRNLQVP